MYVFFGWQNEVLTNNKAAALSVCKERELHGGVPTQAILQSGYGANLTSSRSV
jgi:hypothetical protein